MLNRYRPGERVSDEDGLDVAALLERHTEYIAKVGCGVSHFQVMMTEHGTQCFRIIRTDGSGTDFSYPHCIPRDRPAVSRRSPKPFDVRCASIFARLAIVSSLPTAVLTAWFPVPLRANVSHGTKRRWITTRPLERSPLRAPRPLSLWRRLLRPLEWSLNVKRPRPVWRACVVVSPVLLFAPTGPPHASRDSDKGSGQTSYPVRPRSSQHNRLLSVPLSESSLGAERTRWRLSVHADQLRP